MLAVAIAAAASAQTKKVSILGDSYSTFTGHNPEGYAPFYPNDRNDVTEVEQTWWSLYIKAMGYQLECENSFHICFSVLVFRFMGVFLAFGSFLGFEFLGFGFSALVLVLVLVWVLV